MGQKRTLGKVLLAPKSGVELCARFSPAEVVVAHKADHGGEATEVPTLIK